MNKFAEKSSLEVSYTSFLIAGIHCITFSHRVKEETQKPMGRRVQKSCLALVIDHRYIDRPRPTGVYHQYHAYHAAKNLRAKDVLGLL